MTDWRTIRREGSKIDISVRHMPDTVGVNPHMNITELARASGVTKGAISQIVKKLETKGVIRRYKKAANDKEVFIELTETGKKTCEERRRINKETIVLLREELDLHSDGHVAFLVHMFHWLDEFMDQTAKMMKSHDINNLNVITAEVVHCVSGQAADRDNADVIHR